MTDALARLAGLIRDRDDGTDGFRLMPSSGGKMQDLTPGPRRRRGALWTTFDADGMEILVSALREGRLR